MIPEATNLSILSNKLLSMLMNFYIVSATVSLMKCFSYSSRMFLSKNVYILFFLMVSFKSGIRMASFVHNVLPLKKEPDILVFFILNIYSYSLQGNNTYPESIGWVQLRSKHCFLNKQCRVGLAQLVRFLMVELTYSGLNHRFDMSVIFMANYCFSGR
jgi:hypothetical protein